MDVKCLFLRGGTEQDQRHTLLCSAKACLKIYIDRDQRQLSDLLSHAAAGAMLLPPLLPLRLLPLASAAAAAAIGSFFSSSLSCSGDCGCMSSCWIIQSSL